MLPYLLFQWPLIKRPSILPNKRLVRRRSLNFCLLTYEILRKYSIVWLFASLQCTDLAQNVFRVNFIHFLHSSVCKFWHPVLSQVFHMFKRFFYIFLNSNDFLSLSTFDSQHFHDFFSTFSSWHFTCIYFDFFKCCLIFYFIFLKKTCQIVAYKNHNEVKLK